MNTYDYTKIDKKVDKIIYNVCLYMNNLNREYIKAEIYKAYIYARDAHEGQIRHSGEYYINHPVEATNILVTLKPDLETIHACLLHDVIEDTPKTSEDIKNDFGETVSFLCRGMEKLSKVKYRGQERNIGSLRKMFIAMAEDLRVVFIKLSDRLHNMQTLHFHPNKIKRERIAQETINIYSPIADRLGLYHIKNGLDEEYLRIMNPNEYRRIKKELNQLEKNNVDFLNNVKNEIVKVIDGKIFNYEIDYRIKSIFSIYKKLEKKGLTNVSELYDLYGIRIIVDSESDCYKTLGIIHSIWIPLPYRFKDYIALPKPNGYKSLHTTVMGLLKSRKMPTEIQIKTYEMKKYSDLGVAAHFEYKENGSVVSKDIDWVNELKEVTENIGDSDFVGSLKIDIFKDRIFVFTPKGDFINLPAGSTPIDFAYYLHTDLGNHIVMSKVNSKVHPLDKELSNGDVVEIIIDKSKTPNPFWISFVKTLKAKNNIKSFLKKENKDVYRERGKDIMNKYLEKSGLGVFDKDLLLLKVIDGRQNTLEDRFSLLEQVGNFSVSPNILIKKIIRDNKIIIKNSNNNNKIKDNSNKFNINNNKKEIIIGGQNDLKYVLDHCCRRKIPEDIVAHINNKGIITIHKRDCKLLKGVNKKRLLSAYIKGNEEDNLLVNLFLSFKEKIGVLKKLSDILYSMNINISSINSQKINKNIHNITLKIIILDYEYMIIDRFLDRLKTTFGSDLIDFKIEKMQKE